MLYAFPGFDALPSTTENEQIAKCAGLGSVSFKDVTVDFTRDEWLQLTGTQRTLYRDVMLENYSHLVSVGCRLTKPEVIFKLEQGEELWPSRGESPDQGDQDRSQENQDKCLWRVSLINKKSLTKKRDNVCRKAPCEYDSCGKSLKNVSESVISDKSHSSRNSDEITACEKFLFDNNQENIPTGKKSDAHSQDRKSLSQTQDLTEQHKIQTLGLLFEDDECGETFLNKSAIIPPTRAQTEEKSPDCTEHGGNISDESARQVLQETHTRKSHSEVKECEKSALLKHQKVNVEEKTQESNENENNFSKKSHLTQPPATHTGEKIFECSHCGKCFYQESHLTQHQKIHTGEKPCESNKCGKTFQKSQPTDPPGSHPGEKPSECDTAPVQLAPPGQQRTQSERRLYVCSECNKSFRQLCPQNPSEDSHRREALSVYEVWEILLRKIKLQSSSEDSHGGETL
ncbi:zinc finger protein 33B isoform X2 [Felis catus]|uniref:zinc finger protein 33B isoform X2 n=1 Tax=Felis catus TaxID=9685 RepID=UPI0002AD4579|nr:zinc finger protein 33B isoform X2 [Felis catus]